MSNSEVRQRAELIVRAHEGEVLKAYDDQTGRVVNPGDTVKGFITVGIGRNLIGKGLTRAESLFLFNNDCDECETLLDRSFPWWRSMTVGRQVALLDFAFNQGVPRLVAKWPNTMAALRDGRFAEVAASLRRTPWYRQVGAARGEAVCGAFETGE